MSDKIELNRRRVLGGLVTIGAAGAAVGAGTFAYFSDSAQSTNNLIEAAEFNLAIGETDGAVTTVEAGAENGNGIKPGDEGEGSSTISNDGELDGYINVTTSENSEGSLDNDLASVLEIDIYIDDDGDTTSTTDQSVVHEGTADGLVEEDGSPINHVFNHTLASGEESNLVIEWRLPTEAEQGEGDTVTFDVEVQLNQVQQDPNA